LKRFTVLSVWLIALAGIVSLGCMRDDVDKTATENAPGFDSDLQLYVEDCVAMGFAIDLVELQDNEFFYPTVGEPGAECKVIGVRSLFPGIDSIKLGETIYLYPYTGAERVIVLRVPNGNWIPIEHLDSVVDAIGSARSKSRSMSKADLDE